MKRRNWEEYFGTKNKYDVELLKWFDASNRNGANSKAICLCPICNKEFTCNQIRKFLYEDCNQIQSCPECSIQRRGEFFRKYKFNTGDILHDNLTVENIFYKDNRQYATVRCSCGNVFDVLSKSLTKKNNPTTECLECSYKKRKENRIKEYEIKPGTIINFLKIIKPGDPIKRSSKEFTTSICECLLCGNKTTIQNIYIKNGDTKSCGCMHSHLEAKTAMVLSERGINFTHGLWFPKILTDNGNPVQFDFQIEDKYNNHICFIECQGLQHYQPDNNFGRQQREETDIKKKNYCKENNLLLYEIRYDEDVEKAVDKILAELDLERE